MSEDLHLHLKFLGACFQARGIQLSESGTSEVETVCTLYLNITQMFMELPSSLPDHLFSPVAPETQQ